MAVEKNNKLFLELYEEIKVLSTKKVDKYIRYRKLNKPLDYNKIKELLFILNYLESIDKSAYTYYIIKGLNKIKLKLKEI